MPVVATDWSEPFLEQAREDLRAAWLLDGNRAECASTFCMLVQMVFEKLAKAAFAYKGQTIALRHDVIRRLFQIMRLSAAGRAALATSPNAVAFVELLEIAHPAVAKTFAPPAPQLEYPWEDAAAVAVLYPARDLYLAQRVKTSKDRVALDCLLFATQLEKQFPNWLP